MSHEAGNPRGVPAGRESPRRRPWWFLAGFLAGAVVALGGSWVWTRAAHEIVSATPTADNQATGSSFPQVKDSTVGMDVASDGLDEAGLRARWEELRVAFIKAAEPLTDALDLADRLRADLPALEAKAREAEAKLIASKIARERAEADYSGPLNAVARGVGEGQPAQNGITRTELLAQQSKTRLEAMKRDRQKAVDDLIAKGETPASAGALAAVHYDLRIKAEENQFQRLQPILDRAKAEKDRDVRFGQPKRLALLHAEVEARRMEEVACQAAWEKAKAEQSEVKSRLENSGLSPDEQHQLDQLLELVRGPGSRPPIDADPLDFLAFLDRFAERLAEIRPARAKLAPKSVSNQFNNLVNRLIREQDKPIPPDGQKD
jgi:hypothetical protein